MCKTVEHLQMGSFDASSSQPSGFAFAARDYNLSSVRSSHQGRAEGFGRSAKDQSLIQSYNSISNVQTSEEGT